MKESCLKYVTYLEKNPDKYSQHLHLKTLTNNQNQLILSVPESIMLHYTLHQNFDIPLVISYTSHINSDQGFLQALAHFINNYLDFSKIDKEYSSYKNNNEATFNLMDKLIKKIDVRLSTKDDDDKDY